MQKKKMCKLKEKVKRYSIKKIQKVERKEKVGRK